MRFILASASLRRQELLRNVVSEYEIMVSSFDESLVPYDGDEETYVMTLARKKAESILSYVDDAYVLGSDTIVSIDGKIFGKPESRKDAYAMIRTLSGRSHKVYSGIALLSRGGHAVDTALAVETEVTFMELSDEEIEEYLDTMDWVDKAGGYGIQGHSGKYIEGIRGDYYNVMGLPLNALYKLLKEYHIIM
jgi:septum formation protein